MTQSRLFVIYDKTKPIKKLDTFGFIVFCACNTATGEACHKHEVTFP